MRTRHLPRALAATLVALGAFVLSTPARAHADAVTEWNAIASATLVADGQGAAATTHLAMVHGAVYDAVNAIDRRHRPYLVAPRAKRWFSEDAAAATAAYTVLTGSRPPVVSVAQQPGLAQLAEGYATSLARIPDGRGKRGGIRVGEAGARAMIAARTDDEIVDARVWSGLHFRTADDEGAAIGRRWRGGRHATPPARRRAAIEEVATEALPTRAPCRGPTRTSAPARTSGRPSSPRARRPRPRPRGRPRRPHARRVALSPASCTSPAPATP